MTGTPEIALTPGETLHGFEVNAATAVENLRLVAYELEHPKSGARLLHLHCDDAENLFSVSFPTPPLDDTGVPHILEHSVLGGSKLFPVRDPFFEMIKMSMATFINAMTGFDRTYYPVASNVRQDLFNLAEVYFDAVFHPLLTDEIFRREAHHLAPANPDEPTGGLTVNGIVYNEMKAYFSRPEGRVGRLLTRELFPDTTYGHESGGDPDHIPDLTYEGLKGFHDSWYHPSNALFILYGDIPTRDYLAFLEHRLEPFSQSDVQPEIGRQPRWAEPRSIADTYAIGAGESTAEKTFIVTNWLAGDGLDPDDRVMMHILSTILVGDDAAPLKKAIIDSKLGHDILFAGTGSVGLETTFAVGIRGSEADRAGAFRDLVLNTLTDIAGAPIDPELVDSAFKRFAYHCREISQMRPLRMMQQVLDSWAYGRDPLTFLYENETLEACRNRYADDPAVFNRMIRERLIENAHRLDLVMKPDKEWQARADAAFAERMKTVRNGLTDDDARQIAADADELQKTSGTPNSPEALATLPQLALGDLPRKPVHIPTSAEELPGGAELLCNDVFANGVNYLALNFDLRGLPAGLWPWLPRYVETIHQLGAAGMNYEQMARRKSANTGGIGCSPNFGLHMADPAKTVWGIRFSLKALDEQLEPALGVLRDLVFEPDPRDNGRFRDVLVQRLAGMRTGLVNDGPGTGRRHAARGLTPEGHLDEIVNGIPQFELLKSLNGRFGERAGDMMDKIGAIAQFIRNGARVTASFTGSDAAAETVEKTLTGWLGQMPAEPIEDEPTGFGPLDAVPHDGLAAPMQVAHCTQIIPAPHPSHPDAPLLLLAMQLLRVDYMVSELRFKGNAYGASCSYGGLAIILSTYADPHVTRTLGVFAALPGYVRRAKWSDAELHRAIISTAKGAVRPIRPEGATHTALARHLSGETPAFREERYAMLLAATTAEVRRALLDVFDANMDKAPVAVVSSREKLEQANRETPGRPLAIRDILPAD